MCTTANFRFVSADNWVAEVDWADVIIFDDIRVVGADHLEGSGTSEQEATPREPIPSSALENWPRSFASKGKQSSVARRTPITSSGRRSANSRTGSLTREA